MINQLFLLKYANCQHDLKCLGMMKYFQEISYLWFTWNRDFAGLSSGSRAYFYKKIPECDLISSTQYSNRSSLILICWILGLSNSTDEPSGDGEWTPKEDRLDHTWLYFVKHDIACSQHHPFLYRHRYYADDLSTEFQIKIFILRPVIRKNTLIFLVVKLS